MSILLRRVCIHSVGEPVEILEIILMTSFSYNDANRKMIINGNTTTDSQPYI